MEVKAGYRQTEVGVIPVDWDVDSLGRFWSVTDCKHVTAAFISNGVPIASIREVQGRFVDLTNAKQTTVRYYDLLIEGGRDPRAGDLILSRNATVGEVAQVADWHPPFAMGQDVCLLRRRSDDYSTDYIQAVLRSPVVRNQLSHLMVGSTFKRANVQQIRNFSVPMPSAHEQRVIAEALSDLNALLGGLDRLIVKKRDLKLAAMQQLLTGQTRLPGFHGEWDVKRLGDVAEIVSGGTPRTTEPAYWNGGIKWCTPTDITRCAGKHLNETERTISQLGLENSGASLLPAGALLLCSRATIGEVKIAAGEICTNQGFKSLVCLPGMSNELLYYKLLTMKQQMVGRASGSTFLEISKANLAALEINTPPPPEQTAIAAVLSDMDAELAALEARRDKTRALKQGMMQELLTGKTRLVPVGGADA